MKLFGTIGEYAAVWAAIGAAGALADPERRRRWGAAALVGPAAVNVNYAVKLAVGRQRPLIEGHPALAKAPSKLSFPSAHATSSLAAAIALGRVEPRARLPLWAWRPRSASAGPTWECTTPPTCSRVRRSAPPSALSSRASARRRRRSA